MDRRLYWSLGVAAAMSPGAHTAVAGEAELQPQLATSGDYSTNPQLRTDVARSGYAVLADMALPTRWQDGRDLLELTPRARLAVVGGDSPLGSDAYAISGQAKHSTERSDLSASAVWRDDSVAATEPTPGTLTRVNARVVTQQLDANWSETVTERLQTVWSATWVDSAFSSTDGTGLTSFRNAAASGLFAEQMTERLTAQFTVGGSQYVSPGLVQRSDSYYAQVGVAGALSPLISYQVAVGGASARATSAGRSATGAVYLANVQYAGLTHKLLLSISKSTQPSGFGTVVDATEATARADWSVNERRSVYLALRAAKTTDTFRTFTIADRSYGAANLGLSWRATEVWDVSGEIRWQSQQLGVGPYAASGRGFGINVAAVRRFGAVRLGRR